MVYISAYKDVTRREYYLILPLVILTIIFGIVPDIILETTYFSIKNLVTYC